jgi:membrane fusion protein (multidrug efflux system)
MIKKLQFPSLNKSAWVLVSVVELLIILVLGTWVGIKMWNEREAKKKVYTPSTMTVEAQPVEVGDFENFVTTVGTLKASESVILRPQEGGKIEKILFNSSAYVKEGDLLVQFDDSVQRAQLQEAQAKVVGYKAEYGRAESLVKRNAFPKSKLDEAFMRYKMAEADVNMIQSKIDQMKLKAPFDGVVGLRDVSVGAYLKPGEDLVTLAQIDPMKVDFKISEVFLGKFSVGQEVDVEVDGFLGQEFTGTIEAIDPTADEAGHSIRVQAALPNKDHLLKPGLFAKVKFRTDIHENAMMVPEAAVESEGNQEYVYVVLDGVAHKAPVVTGNRNGKNVEIRSGLKPGLMVVTAGQLRIGEGSPVVVVPHKESHAY